MRRKKKIEKLGFFLRGFPKGSMILVKTFKIFHVFILDKIGQENVFDDILDT